MDVVYVSNEKYAPHLGVSLYSLYDRNTEEDNLNVTVFSTGLSSSSVENLEQIAEEFGRQISISDLTDLRDRLSFDADTGRFDISTLGRFFIGDLLPVTTQRVIYLDCDTVILHPLTKMWNTDLKGKLLAAVQEPTIYPEVRSYLGMKKDEAYFNAGVFLADLTRWRAEKIRRKLILYYRSIEKESLFHDQDAINGLLKGEIRNLSPAWNFFTNYRYFHYRDLTGMSSSYRVIPEDAFEKAKKHPAVVHFAGDERPWKAGSLNYYGQAYRMYLELTPWRGTPKERGSEGRMLAYHAMDWMTFVYPAGRKKISEAFVRKLTREKKEKEKGKEI